MSKHDWTYVRTNSKGEKIFRKETNESLDFVCDYLLENDIHFKVNKAASLIVIHNKNGKEYMYYWTTGRWSPRKRKYNKHYHSDGVEDFVKKYLNRTFPKKENRNEITIENNRNTNTFKSIFDYFYSLIKIIKREKQT